MPEIMQTNVHYVPSSYFNDLSEEIIKKINLPKEVLQNLSLITPYKVPENYFKHLSELILLKIYTAHHNSKEVFEETEAIAPVLNTISKKTIYSIPADFFEKRQTSHIEPQKSEAKVVSFYNKSKILKYAAAAAIVLFLSIKLFTIPEKNAGIHTAFNNARKEVKNLSKEEIIRFLKSNIPVENVTSVTKQKSKTENAIKSSLKQISDKEIQQYLIETGESDEI